MPDLHGKDLTELVFSDIAFISSKVEQDDEAAPEGFWERTLIKTVLSYIEAALYSVKIDLLKHCDLHKVDVDADSRAYLRGRKIKIDENGESKEHKLVIKLKEDIKLYLNLSENLLGSARIRSTDDGYTALTDTILTRHRLTHPKTNEHLVVSKKEVRRCVVGYDWFMGNLIGFEENKLAKEKDAVAAGIAKIAALNKSAK